MSGEGTSGNAYLTPTRRDIRKHLGPAAKSEREIIRFNRAHPLESSLGQRALPSALLLDLPARGPLIVARVVHERRVELCIKLSRIFRAHWTDDAVHTTEAERVVFSGRASAAREGLVLLMQAGWRIEMLSPEDWNFLIGLSDPYVGRGEGEAVDERSGERCGVCASEAATGPPEAEAKAGEGQGIETMDTQACVEEPPLPPAPPPPPSPFAAFAACRFALRW